jgi:hypothetical protein
LAQIVEMSFQTRKMFALRPQIGLQRDRGLVAGKGDQVFVFKGDSN